MHSTASIFPGIVSAWDLPALGECAVGLYLYALAQYICETVILPRYLFDYSRPVTVHDDASGRRFCKNRSFRFVAGCSYALHSCCSCSEDLVKLYHGSVAWHFSNRSETSSQSTSTSHTPLRELDAFCVAPECCASTPPHLTAAGACHLARQVLGCTPWQCRSCSH
ncbi:hypothetical protein K438DRAFT_1818523 [Mycena galopus ATCC 62051]|nr:hypothetical protein K438DRAFT_1818523 [Mycena galopus ATCC 62051]